MRYSQLLVVSLASGGFITSNGISSTSKEEYGEWRYGEFVDEITGSKDRRLILRSAESETLVNRPQANFLNGPTIVIVCGDRIVNDTGRTLLFFPG